MNKYIKSVLLLYIVLSLCIIAYLSISLSKTKTNNEFISMGSYVYIENDGISVNIDTIKEKIELIDQNNRLNYIELYNKVDKNVIEVEIPEQYIIIILCYENKIDMIVINSDKDITVYECEKKSDYMVSFEMN